uniref:Uncharacterized protein n=1 Tax=Anguilla anguilla TaxID=7936 RepID=A0A0E9XQ94_ANGAN
MKYALECLKRLEQKPESVHAGFLKYLDECLQEKLEKCEEEDY